MKRFGRCLRAISPVLAVLMMIAVAIAGSLVVYAWVMGYIGFQTQKSGESIQIHSIANVGSDLVVYVQNVGETVVQLEEGGCLYVDGRLVHCTISQVSVTGGVATLGLGETAKLRYVGGATRPGEKVEVKVTTKSGTSFEDSAYPAGTAEAAPGSMMWNRTFGGSETCQVFSLISASDGGYVVAGLTSPEDSMGSDVLLVKFDLWGNVEWSRVYGEDGVQEIVYEVVETSDGGYAMAGLSVDFLGVNEEFLLIKTDGDGNLQWNRTYGGAGGDRASALVEASGGGYALAGYTRAEGFPDFDGFLVRTDASGEELWNRTFGGTGHDNFASLVEVSGGGYVLAGSTDSLGAGSNDMWLVKTDASGAEEWSETYGGADWDNACCVIKTSGGGYVLAGATRPDSVYDTLLVKVDGDGRLVWSQAYGGVDNERVDAVVQTSDGGYALAGYTRSYGAGDSDFWLVKTDALGILEWDQTYGGTQWDTANDLVISSDGGYAIAGHTQSFGVEADNVWIVKTY